MSKETAHVEEIDSTLREKIMLALEHFKSEAGELRIADGGARRHGKRLQVPVQPLSDPPSLWDLVHAVAGAEIELRDQGIDIELTPEYRQKFIVVARVPGHPAPYIYESRDGAEYDDLAQKLGIGSKFPGGQVEIEGYPFDNAEDRESARQAASKEYPTAKELV